MKTQLLRASLFCTSLFLFQSCSDDKTTTLKDLKWMLGNWESKTDEGILYEDWKKVDDSTYNGHAYAISLDGDTTFNELLIETESCFLEGAFVFADPDNKLFNLLTRMCEPNIFRTSLS